MAQPETGWEGDPLVIQKLDFRGKFGAAWNGNASGSLNFEFKVVGRLSRTDNNLILLLIAAGLTN